MSGGDFDFRPPAPRREPKRFEPPPWEEDAFADLKRREQDEEQDPPGLLGERAEEQEAGEEAAPPKRPPAAPQAEQVGVATEAKPAIDDGRVLEMLAGLAEEDPPPARAYYGVSMASALLLVGIGVVLLVWAMAAFVGARKTGSFGVIAGAALAVFGVGFVSGGFWLGYRTLKRRGVL